MSMAADGAGLRPGVVAGRLGIAVSTLRIYSVKLASLLSAEAGRPRRRLDGRPGVRVYTASDLALLARAKELLEKGLTYEEVAAELNGQSGAARDAERKTRRRSSVGEFESAMSALSGALERAMAATEAWQRLAEERERDLVALRARVEALETMLANLETNRRKPWWLRLRAR